MSEKIRREGPPDGLIIIGEGVGIVRDSRQWCLWVVNGKDNWANAESYHGTIGGLLREVLRRDLLTDPLAERSAFGLAESCEAAERRVLEMGARLEVMWGAK